MTWRKIFRRGLIAVLFVVAGLSFANGTAYAAAHEDIQKYTAQILNFWQKI